MNENENLEKFLYAAIFLVGGVVAGFHTYSVNALVNPPIIAVLSAIAVDGLLAYVMHSIRKQFGSRRWASAVGILLFGTSSAACQVIYQKITSGVPLEPWLQFTGTYIIPVASGTGSFVTVALIQLFGQGKPEQKSPSLSIVNIPQLEVVNKPESVPNWPGVPAPASMAMDASPMKRKAGRPPKAFNAEATPGPKVLTNTKKS